MERAGSPLSGAKAYSLVNRKPGLVLFQTQADYQATTKVMCHCVCACLCINMCVPVLGALEGTGLTPALRGLNEGSLGWARQRI